MSRIPLWATLAPLVLGILLWLWLWRGYAADFRAELEKALPADTAIEISGFPYRLEARVQHFDARGGDVLHGAVRADELVVNRVPWQRNRQVLSLRNPVAEVEVAPLAGAGIEVAAPESQASLHLEQGRLARLSMVWEQAAIKTGLLPVQADARHFEAHVRELPADGAASANAARAEIILSGEDVQFGGGDPLSLAVEAEVQGRAPLEGYAGWADGGIVAIRSASLTDAGGEVARFSGMLKPDGHGAMQLQGAVETVCPATVRAALQGLDHKHEMRARKPVVLAVSGAFPGDLTTPPADPSKPPPPVRGQDAPCPRLRAG